MDGRVAGFGFADPGITAGLIVAGAAGAAAGFEIGCGRTGLNNGPVWPQASSRTRTAAAVSSARIGMAVRPIEYRR